MRTAPIFLQSDRFPTSQDIPMLSHANTNTSATSSVSIAGYLAAHCQQADTTDVPDRVERILQLASAGAWTDAALALLELEQPEWELRRLVREDGEWFCSLSRRPDLPIELDDAAEAHNEQLPLAILDALAEAREKNAFQSAVRATRSAAGKTITSCCDNFG
jgi:hypothetical protein